MKLFIFMLILVIICLLPSCIIRDAINDWHDDITGNKEDDDAGVIVVPVWPWEEDTNSD